MTVKLITIKEDILGANEEKAEKNRKLLDENGILMVNIMSSPGSGKTSLILQTINSIKKKARIAVIEGDIASTIDADKVSEQGIPAVQINTAGGCHLDANMIEQALDNLPLENIDLVFIENVGNLICPAEFALGEHRRLMLLSTPEGDDKPYKYPIMFSDADVVLLNKIDLSPLLDFDVDSFTSAVKGLNSKAKIFQVSCKTGQGLEEWFSWLESQMESRGS
ncbi:hydrogenase nickel incorporation protein HypB [Chloroflexota bacterium]